MADGFWQSLGKVAAVTAGVGATAGAITKGVSSCLKTRFDRKIKQQETDLKAQKQLLDQEIKLRQLELQQHKIDTGNSTDVTLAQLKAQQNINVAQLQAQQAIQTTGMNAHASVLKAQAMYDPASPLANANGMVYDQSAGIAFDNRNVVYANQPMPYGNNPYGMGMMNMGNINNQAMVRNQGMNINQIQEKILEARNLLNQGIITQEEFERVKKDILDDSF